MAVLLHNKKVGFDYEILERFEAGLELVGHEVKSLRNKLGSLDGSYVTVRGAEAFIINMSIPAYQQNNIKNYDPERNRKLLLTKDEILKLASIERGLTIVPITVYNKGRKIKIEIASVRNKKKFDKREVMKKKDAKREIERTLKNK
ncbi:SsrA-binding protein SmpB [Candidatus Parcubacteria bacterium]|nr:SsrA-binding protein SmpB [Candidatus Parcubacteria bacterium]